MVYGLDAFFFFFNFQVQKYLREAVMRTKDTRGGCSHKTRWVD